MNRRNTVGTALVGLAVVLFVVPAFVPVQPVLTHNTQAFTPGTGEDLAADGFRIVAYENLSDRGQELYRTTLERGGQYQVPAGRGAPEFDYPTDGEVARARGESETRPGSVVVERAVEHEDLPRPDEHFTGAVEEEGEGPVNETVLERRRQQTLRFDLMQTRTGQPSLNSPPQLARLVAALLAVLSMGLGGYLLSSK